jgi:hypothetical protein
MSVPYPFRVYLVALEADPTARPWVLALCLQLGDGGDEAESRSCSTSLVLADDPTGPIAGYAMSTPIGPMTYGMLMALADAGQVPSGIVWAACDLDGVVLRNSHDPAVVGMVFDLEGSMRRVGLASRQTESL